MVSRSRFSEDIQKGELTCPQNVDLCVGSLHNPPALCLSRIHWKLLPNLNFFPIFASFPLSQYEKAPLEQTRREKMGTSVQSRGDVC